MRKIIFLLVALMPATLTAAPPWTYDAIGTGQDEWAGLSETYSACNAGMYQSPITIGNTTSKALPALEFGYKAGEAKLSLDRYTIVTTPKDKQSYKEGSITAQLKELIIRTPSEHEIGNMFYPIELQLVHETADKRLFIISVFMRKGAANKTLQTILDHYPVPGQSKTANIDWQGLLPKKRGYYAYAGSISYPPCTEGVEIRVLKEQLEVSQEQFMKLSDQLGRSSRLTQPAYMRPVYESID